MDADERRWDELNEKIVGCLSDGLVVFRECPHPPSDPLTSSAFICVYPRWNLFDPWKEPPISAEGTN